MCIYVLYTFLCISSWFSLLHILVKWNSWETFSLVFWCLNFYRGYFRWHLARHLVFWCLNLLDLTCFLNQKSHRLGKKRFKTLLKLVDKSHFLYLFFARFKLGMEWWMHLSGKGNDYAILRNPPSKLVHWSIIIHHCIARKFEQSWIDCMSLQNPSVRISIAMCACACLLLFCMRLCVTAYVCILWVCAR